MPTFQTIAFLSYFRRLLSTFHIRITDTYAFIIRFLVFILMCRLVIVFNIELNAPLAISILFKMSSSHFPFGVIVCPKYVYICQFV